MCIVKNKVSPRGGGFTMIELILVMSIGVLLLAVTMPIGFNFYRSILLQDITDEVSTLLRHAGDEARLGKNDIPHGIYFGASTITHFQGTSYLGRVVGADEVTAVATDVALSGLPSEIVFAKHSGIPSATGTLTISLFSNVRALRLDTRGMVTEIAPNTP